MTIEFFKRRVQSNGLDANSTAVKELYNLLNGSYRVSKPALIVPETDAAQLVADIITAGVRVGVGLFQYNNSTNREPSQTCIKLSERGLTQKFSD